MPVLNLDLSTLKYFKVLVLSYEHSRYLYATSTAEWSRDHARDRVGKDKVEEKERARKAEYETLYNRTSHEWRHGS